MRHLNFVKLLLIHLLYIVFFKIWINTVLPGDTVTIMNYEGRERRANNLTEDRVALMIQEAVSEALKSHEQHLKSHIDSQFAALKQSFADAFPGGDPHGHRVAHEHQITNATNWDKLKLKIVEQIATGGIWAAAGFALLALWDAIKREITK